jgi:hypothetical protein
MSNEPFDTVHARPITDEEGRFVDDYRIEIHHDQDAGNPADEWDNYSAEEVEAWRYGQVFGWVVTRADTGDLVDSCWGYYGGPDSETWNYMIQQARDQVDHERKKDAREQAERRFWEERDTVTR